MRASVVLALMLTIPSLPASAESMRCGKWVVSETRYDAAGRAVGTYESTYADTFDPTEVHPAYV